MKYTLVLTTINIPDLLYDFGKNASKYKADDVSFIVIGDKKTPHQKCVELVNKVQNKYGINCRYYSPEDQEKWMQNFPKLNKIIPYNSDARRNIGYLMAYESKSNLITIDDDNYPLISNNYFKDHSIVGREITAKSVSSSNKWYNPCDVLETSNGTKIYSRGFPYSKRWNDEYYYTKETGEVAINMGLWTNSPDVDALTNLINPVTIKKVRNLKPVIVERSNFCPINSQNTAVLRDAIPCYYYVQQNQAFGDIYMDRFGDIWQGFFAKKVIDSLGKKVTIGAPIVDHRRNTHNYFEDLKKEFYGILITEILVGILEKLVLNGKNYSDCYVELSDIIENLKMKDNARIQRYLAKVGQAMRLWVDTCDKLR